MSSSSSLSTAISHIITNPAYQPYLAILKGARNGAVYGTKVRFPNALVMTLLWGQGDWKIRIRRILSLTRQHATALATFVSIYKRWMNGDKPRPLDTFVAGLIGGYVAFGDQTTVNEQVALYVCSRVALSLLPRAYKSPYNDKTHPPSTVRSEWVTKRPIPPNAMWFQSEWWDSLRTLLWHNN
ncbi:hypothetical protein Clacol_003816 [Clathrus columnatus]|uniref:Peroxisomal membrane protein 4 n=1 Tax=Clathrus columnatus TaxID=1419009 RepID=A0AAV5A8S7_9AGAM|nr:hypothetical protein Clacol_003816 [Clathrus columnatus]